jgi:hypothetical protein
VKKFFNNSAFKSLAVGMLCLGLTAGCALYRNDHCWVAEPQYQTAREMFLATGSLDLVQARLTDMQWRRCKVNEILYRLGKEFDVLPDELPVEPAS